MTSMAHRSPVALAALVAVGAFAFFLPTAGPVAAAVPVDGGASSGLAEPLEASSGAIVPGSVGRTSLFLDATYDTYLAISWGPRSIYVDSTATIRNTSGGAIDRVELNTIAARLGAIRPGQVTVDGTTVAATISDQTIVVPLGGILPVGGVTQVRVRYGATVHSTLTGSTWMFTRANGVLDLYRWLPWVSRRIAFDRPNHGDPFETPTSRSVKVRINSATRLVLATSGTRTAVSADGLSQTFQATDVRDFTVTAARDYRTKSRVVAGTTVRVYYRPGGPGTAMLDAAANAFAALRSRLGPYPHPTFNVVQSAGGYGMESPAMIWIPTGQASANLRYLVTHETAHQWFYGIVGNDQATNRSSTRLPPISSPATSSACAAPAAARPRVSTGGSTTTRPRATTRTSTSRAATCWPRPGRRWARQHSGPRCVATSSPTTAGSSTTSTLLDALDAATPIDLGARVFGPRFPRLY